MIVIHLYSAWFERDETRFFFGGKFQVSWFGFVFIRIATSFPPRGEFFVVVPLGSINWARHLNLDGELHPVHVEREFAIAVHEVDANIKALQRLIFFS